MGVGRFPRARPVQGSGESRPCIIFIDEDRHHRQEPRCPSKFGGNDEREQTLRPAAQRSWMGFDPSKGHHPSLGATNRPEVLDKACCVPAASDRRITVDRPNLAGRLATLQVHTRNIRLSEDVDLNKIAQATRRLRRRGPCKPGQRSPPARRAPWPPTPSIRKTCWSPLRPSSPAPKRRAPC